MWVLGGLLFVGMGVFNAATTWLDSILGHFGRAGAAGYLIAIMTIAGILGAAVVPQAVAKHDRRQALLQVTVGVTAVAFLAIATLHNVAFVGVVLFVEGFVLLAALPVVLDWSELHAGPERAGAAVGFLLLAGNFGGVVLDSKHQGTPNAPGARVMSPNEAIDHGALPPGCLPSRSSGGRGRRG